MLFDWSSLTHKIVFLLSYRTANRCMIPDRCYATMYQEIISYLKSNNQFDVATMGNVVGILGWKFFPLGALLLY